MAVQNIQIDSIVIPEIRSNAVYTPDKYHELKESIAVSGVQFRPVVRPLPDQRYELIDGKHRIQVWRELGHTDIDVEVEQLTDEQAFVKHVTANHHRGENDPVGLASVIKKLREGGKTYEDIGRIIGYSASTVGQYALLADLPEVYRKAVSSGQLKLAHIREASRLDDPTDMDAALTFSIQYGWPATTLHHWVENRICERSASPQGPVQQDMQYAAPPPPDPNLAQYRTCLICGAHGVAQEMFYPVLGKECHDSLKYLLSVDKNPWSALQVIITQMNELNDELNKKDAKIKELSDRLIELSMQFVPRAPAAYPMPQPQPQQVRPGVLIPNIPSGDGTHMQ